MSWRHRDGAGGLLERRARFTSTAGRISLMNELLGFGYYAEIPAVVVDVQAWSSTGMPTRTQQSDVMLRHTRRMAIRGTYLLFPANRTNASISPSRRSIWPSSFKPVIMMSDLDIGMNDWVLPRLTWDDS
jgi:2-oxoglutarate ferredoxin oxidoreductase subunit alpha